MSQVRQVYPFLRESKARWPFALRHLRHLPAFNVASLSQLSRLLHLSHCLTCDIEGTQPERSEHGMGLRTVHLFAGTGGGIWGGLLVGHIPVCAVEIDPYCQSVLIQRQCDGDFPAFSIWDDVRTFGREVWSEHVDCLHAGFPCQPWSLAGKRKGQDDTRNLWPDTLRIIGELRPRYLLLENVAALVAHPYFRDTILGQLTEARYDLRWCTLGADDVGANHQRKRVWIYGADARHAERQGRDDTADGDERAGNSQRHELAPLHCEVPHSQGCHRDISIVRSPWEQTAVLYFGRNGNKEHVANHDGVGRRQERLDTVATSEGFPKPFPYSWWAAEPNLDRVADGISDRRHRLKALGNSQVPLCSAVAWCLLAGT